LSEESIIQVEKAEHTLDLGSCQSLLKNQGLFMYMTICTRSQLMLASILRTRAAKGIFHLV